MTVREKISALELEYHAAIDDMNLAVARREPEGVEECAIHVLSLAKSICFLAPSRQSRALNSQPSTLNRK